MNLLSPYRWLLAVGLSVGLWLGYEAWAGYEQAVGEARATKRYNAAIEAQKADAARSLAALTVRVAAREQALQDLKNLQEVQDGKNQRTIDDLGRRLRGMAGAAGRLRDANAAGCWSGSGSAAGQAAANSGDRPADGAETGGLLSEELSGLLIRLAGEADAINVAYASCRADAQAVRR